jgi:hypothetical protein
MEYAKKMVGKQVVFKQHVFPENETQNYRETRIQAGDLWRMLKTAPCKALFIMLLQRSEDEDVAKVGRVTEQYLESNPDKDADGRHILIYLREFKEPDFTFFDAVAWLSEGMMEGDALFACRKLAKGLYQSYPATFGTAHLPFTISSADLHWFKQGKNFMI